MEEKTVKDTLETRVQKAQEELDKVLKKYSLGLAIVPAVVPVQIGKQVVYTLGGEIKFVDIKTK